MAAVVRQIVGQTAANAIPAFANTPKALHGLCGQPRVWPPPRCGDSRLPPTPVLADDGPMETVTMPQVHKSGGLIGAEVRGLDLTRQCPDATYQAILRAWAEHGVIFLRDQHLNAEQRDAFASKLGEIRVRQEVRKEPEQTKAIGEGWHTDMTCFEEPPKATMLFCEEVPPWGGDTQWAAMGPTFEALSAGLQATLLGLGAIHANVPASSATATPRPILRNRRSPSTTRPRA